MKKAKLLATSKSQTVRLPKANSMKVKEVSVTKIGNKVALFPKHEKWDSLIESLDKFSDDFMEVRNQPELEKR